MNMNTLDSLYKELLIAQLDKNWGKVAKIQKDINRAEADEIRLSRNSCREEGEGEVAEDTQDLRDHEGTVR